MDEFKTDFLQVRSQANELGIVFSQIKGQNNDLKNQVQLLKEHNELLVTKYQTQVAKNASLENHIDEIAQQNTRDLEEIRREILGLKGLKKKD